MARIKFDRARIESAIEAAYKASSDKPLYVYATAYGYVIDKSPAPFGQQYVIVEQNKPAQYIKSKWE